ANAQTGLHDPALDDRQFFVRDLDAEIAARHHDAVGLLDDGIEVFDGFLVFDLRDDQRTTRRFPDERLELPNVPRGAHERKRNEIDADFQAEFHIGFILRSKGGKADFDAGQVDVTAAAELAVGEDFAFDLVAMLGVDLHLNGAVVNQDGVALADVVDEIGVVHVHGIFLLALRAADGEGKFLAGLEIERHRKVAGADGRALGIHENADHFVPGGGANVPHDAAGPVVWRVGHVETENVDAGIDQAGEHFR